MLLPVTATVAVREVWTQTSQWHFQFSIDNNNHNLHSKALNWWHVYFMHTLNAQCYDSDLMYIRVYTMLCWVACCAPWCNYRYCYWCVAVYSELITRAAAPCCRARIQFIGHLKFNISLIFKYQFVRVRLRECNEFVCALLCCGYHNGDHSSQFSY